MNIKIYNFEEVGSTNDVAKEQKYQHGDIICAERQISGRGQRGNKWLSPKGENITMSMVLEPTSVAVEKQFFISKVVTLALADAMRSYGIEVRIKWPNDIYVGDKKLMGILIENNLNNGVMSRSVPGIGINVNQTKFDPTLPNPTSMRVVTGREFLTEEVVACVAGCIAERYAQLERGEYETIMAEYHKLLYRLDEPHRFRYPQGAEFTATIRGALPTGDLVLEHEGGECRTYLFKEVEYII